MGAEKKGAVFKSSYEIFIMTLQGMERYSQQRFNLSPFPTQFCIITIASPLSRIKTAAQTSQQQVHTLLGCSRYRCQLGYDMLQQEEKISIKVLGNSADVGRAGCMQNSNRTDRLDRVSQFRHWSVNKAGSEKFPDCTRLLV